MICSEFSKTSGLIIHELDRDNTCEMFDSELAVTDIVMKA